MIAKNNEEKRNQIWRAVMAVTTVLIIIIAAFFVIKLFTANPLEGKWSHEDSSLLMTIKGGDTAILEWPDEFDGTNGSVELECIVEKELKTFTLQVDEDAVQEAADESDGAVTAEELEVAVGTMEGTYDYNIEQNILTLTDREYGDQMIFDKK